MPIVFIVLERTLSASLTYRRISPLNSFSESFFLRKQFTLYHENTTSYVFSFSYNLLLFLIHLWHSSFFFRFWVFSPSRSFIVGPRRRIVSGTTNTLGFVSFRARTSTAIVVPFRGSLENKVVASAMMLNPQGDVVISVSSRQKFTLSKHQPEISVEHDGGRQFHRRFRWWFQRSFISFANCCPCDYC